MPLYLLFLLILASCAKELPSDAARFSIETFDGYRVLNIKEAWNGDGEKHKWVLLDSQNRQNQPPKLPDSLKNVPQIAIPVKKAVVLSTTAIAFMERLDLLERIVAVENKNLIYSENAQNLPVKEVGSGNSLDLETILIMQPDVVLTFGTGSSTYDDYPRLKTANIPAILTAEWMESHPITRLEWIKVFGALFGKEKEADSIFTETKKKYNALAELAQNATKKPIVLTGYPQGSEWLAGGGKSYFAKFLQNAGAKYIWENTDNTGTLNLNIETALQSGAKAEFWLHPSLWTSKAEILRNDPRMTMINGKIYQSSKRIGKNGSRDFYEGAVAHPDLVLADLIFIFHPEILPEHKFVYYEQLK